MVKRIIPLCIILSLIPRAMSVWSQQEPRRTTPLLPPAVAAASNLNGESKMMGEDIVSRYEMKTTVSIGPRDKAIVEILQGFFFGSVVFDVRAQLPISVFAINDAFRKVVRRVLEDSFLPRQSRQFEVSARSPGFRMSHVINV
jgi:hypothetical protein